MNALVVDPNTLVDEFEYYEYLGKEDAYGKHVYDDPIQIENVRIDRTTVLSRDSKETKVVANAVIFCYASATTPFNDIEFVEDSKVVFDDKKHIIRKIVPCPEPYSKNLWSIELEVI